MTFPTFPIERLLARLNPPQQRVKLVLDTDLYNEIDDQFALAYALLSPQQLDVAAIYAAPFENRRSNNDPQYGMEKSYAVAQEMLAKLDGPVAALPPVFKGADRWMTNDMQRAGFSGAAVHSQAAEHLIALAEAQPDDAPLYVVGIAAITNVASAILLKPEIINKIVVVWLGGHPHNYHHTDEFNLKQDIYASRVLLDSGVPLITMPCFNVAEHLVLTSEDARNRIKGRGAIGDYLHDEFVAYADEEGALSRPIWDIAPLAWLINAAWIDTALIPSPLLMVNPIASPVTFARTSGARFAWARDPQRHLIREAYRVRRDAIFQDFYAKLGSVHDA